MAGLPGTNDNAGAVVRNDIHISVIVLDGRVRARCNRVITRVVGLYGHRRGQVRKPMSLGGMRLVFGRRACHNARSLSLLERAEDNGDMGGVVSVFEPLGDAGDPVVGHKDGYRTGCRARYR